MKYTITFACGHTCKIDLFGKKETRDWIAKQKENELCPECYAEERKKEKLKMQQKNLEDGMPMLSGSEKQVLWAEEIRRDFLKKFDRVLEELHEGFDKDPQLAQALMDIVVDLQEEYFGCSSASWWIEHREDRLERIAGSRYKNKQEDKPVTFVPDDEKHPDVVIVEIKEGRARFYYPKYETFYQFMKENGAFWADMWMMDSKSEFHDSLADKIAWVISELLKLGFSVRTSDPEVINLLKTDTFHVKPKCAIINKYARYVLAIGAQGEAEEMALSIRGSKKISKGIMIPKYKANTIEEFAEIYGFTITKEAQRCLDNEKEIEKIRLNGTQREIQELCGGSVSDILDSSFDVLEDLKDED